MAVGDVDNIGVGLPGAAFIISAGSLVSTVLVVMICTCCQRPKVPQHKANVRKNVVEEEEIRTNTLSRERLSERRRKGRPPSIFEGTTIGVGRWDDLTEIAENEIPNKFRKEKPFPERPPNPPDVIIHPNLIQALKSKNRPQSTIYVRTPVSPPLLGNAPPSTSLEELIAQHTEEKPDTPLSRYSVKRGDGVEEKSKDGSILYYRPKESVEGKRLENLSDSRRLSRDRIRSSEDSRPVREKQGRTRYDTPSDPGSYVGLPHYDRTSGEWDNVPKPRMDNETPPPLPSRRYLDDDVEINAGVSHSDSSDDMSRPQDSDVPLERPPHVEEARNSSPRSVESNSQQNSRTSSPKQRLSDYKHGSRSSGKEFQHRARLDHAHRDDPDRHRDGSENMAYSQDGSPARRDHGNLRLHPDDPRIRQGDPRARPTLGDGHVMLDERQRHHQRHRRVNDLIQESVPLNNYDPNRVHLQPGVYLRPKPYYPQAGMPEPTKRYSDASDYSDVLYERNSYYGDRVNRDYDPYFFRSRWSATPDSIPDEMLRRHNSDFVVPENFAIPSRDPPPGRLPTRRSLIIEEHYDSDVIRDQATNAGRSSNLSSGYQSQSSRNDESPSDFNFRTRGRILPTPPRSADTPPGPRGRSLHSRTSQSSIQDMPLPDVPFRYHSPERNVRNSTPQRRYLPSQVAPPPPDVAPERYGHRGTRPDITIEGQAFSPSSPGVSRRSIKSPTHSYDITADRFRSPLPTLQESQNAPSHPQEVSTERSRSPTRSQKGHTEPQPDVIESHSISTQAPEVVARGQQTDFDEEDFDEENRQLEDVARHSAAPSYISSSSDLSASSKRPSTEYGSLIDIMYQYRQNVRESRKKENPAESPESRLRFEREKLKSKLKKELEPRQTSNLDLVIDTLLYLCERDNSTVNKRSWQRNHQDRRKSKSRPNSAVLLPPADDYNNDRGSRVISIHSDVTKGSNDYASIHGESSICQDHVTKQLTDNGNGSEKMVESRSEEGGGKVVHKLKARRIHDYCEIKVANTAPPDSHGNEFAFPSEEELERLLAQNTTPPPIPPRRRKEAKQLDENGDISAHVSPGRNIDAQSPPLQEETGIKSESVTEKDSQRTSSPLKNSNSVMPLLHQETPKTEPDLRVKESTQEPPYAKVNKRRKPARRRSLPSMHLSESEMKWLIESGGTIEDVRHRKYSKFDKGRRGEPRFQSTRVRGSKKEALLHDHMITSPVAKPIEEDQEMFTFNDIQLGENADAEDVISAIERRMSERKSPLKTPKEAKRSLPNSPLSTKLSTHSDSDMGTWSSTASADIPPPPPRRARFNRSDGYYPASGENTPSSSPIFMEKHRFHTPPPDDAPPSIPTRKESLSPQGNHSFFQTPPISPHGPSPLTSTRRASSVANITMTTSPKIQPQTPVHQFAPRKQHGFSKRAASPRFMQQKPSSVPTSPATGPLSQLKRVPSRFAPKLPFGGKKFVQPTTPNKLNASAQSDRMRISRTGEIITLPDDDDYAIPFDCLRNNASAVQSPNRAIPNARQQRSKSYAPLSPPLFITQSSNNGQKVTVIREEASLNDGDEDYAIPVNSPPNLLLMQRILSRSSENILRDYETAV